VIAEAFPQCAVLRMHPPPDQRKLDEVVPRLVQQSPLRAGSYLAAVKACSATSLVPLCGSLGHRAASSSSASTCLRAPCNAT
jgi:hypothetical protein